MRLTSSNQFRTSANFSEVLRCLLDKRVPQAAYTRWLTRGKCVKYLGEHLIAVVSVLESLSETADDATTRCDAQGLLRQLKT